MYVEGGLLSPGSRDEQDRVVVQSVASRRRWWLRTTEGPKVGGRWALQTWSGALGQVLLGRRCSLLVGC